MEVLRSAFEAAVARHRANDLPAAIAGYRDILRQAPDLAFVTDNLCQALLAAGDYAEGFALYDVRFSRRHNAVRRPNLPFREWQGEPLAGRSLVILPEQGFGDQIMFARFTAQLREESARVTLVAPRELLRTFSALEIDVVSSDIPFARHDLWCMIGSLPARLRLTRAELTGAPYLRGGSGGEGIGIAWRGRPTHHNDAQRSLPEALAARLLGLPGAIDLDPMATGARDFEDTANIIRSLRLVISVDTAIAHLAGAMGTPTYCLLPATGVDWRWGVSGSTTAWYRTMTLLRAGPSGWPPLIEALAARVALDHRPAEAPPHF